MIEPTLKKIHDLLEKLTNYVMSKVSTKDEVDQKIVKVDTKIDKLAEYVMKELPTRREVDGKIDKLAEYMMNEVPTKREMDARFEQVEKRLDCVEGNVKETKRDVKLILNGMDSQVKENEILKTEQAALKSGLSRVEKRVDVLEKKVE